MAREINIWLNHNPYRDKKKAKPYSDRILQQLLQQALNTSEVIDIHKNSNGKPQTNHPVFFSHSNSKQLHAYVISEHFDVGIDVEHINPERAVMAVAKRYFHPSEYQQMQHTAAEKQLDMFYKQWTQKEAWCKLEGGNLWSYLGQTPDPNTPLYLYHTKLIQGFDMAIASSQAIDNIRINSIGNQ